MGLLISIVVTIVAVVAAFLLTAWRAPDAARRVEQRLSAIGVHDVPSIAAANVELLRGDELSDMPWLDRLLRRWSRSSRFQAFLAQAGMETKPGKIFLSAAVLFTGGYIVGNWLFNEPAGGIFIGLCAGSIPFLTVSVRRHKRLRAFEKNFPEAIDLLSRAVRAGHALNTGMEVVGQELSEPVAGEFRKTFEEQSLGLGLREALHHLAERVPTQDMRFFVTALIIQSETGGNLAEILDNLANTIRERFKIRGEVRVRTAQGRLTAAVLMALPPAMLLVLRITDPSYVNILFTDSFGRWMLAIAAILQIIGAFVLWKIVQIEV